MNDFLNEYDYFYHYTKAENEQSIRARGLEPRTPSTGPGADQPIMIACLAKLDDTERYLRDLRAYPDQPKLIVCRIQSSRLLDFDLSLDWSSETTRTHWDGQLFPFVNPETDAELDQMVKHSIDNIGVLAVCGTIPPSDIEFLSVDDLIGPEPQRSDDRIDMNDFKPFP